MVSVRRCPCARCAHVRKKQACYKSAPGIACRMNNNGRSPLISVRAAVVLLLSALTATAGFKLSLLAGDHLASSVIFGGAVFATAVYFFDFLLGDR